MLRIGAARRPRCGGMPRFDSDHPVPSPPWNQPPWFNRPVVGTGGEHHNRTARRPLPGRPIQSPRERQTCIDRPGAVWEHALLFTRSTAGIRRRRPRPHRPSGPGSSSIRKVDARLVRVNAQRPDPWGRRAAQGDGPIRAAVAHLLARDPRLGLRRTCRWHRFRPGPGTAVGPPSPVEPSPETSAYTYVPPRNAEATAAISQATVSKPNATASPSGNGPEIRDDPFVAWIFDVPRMPVRCRLAGSHLVLKHS